MALNSSTRCFSHHFLLSDRNDTSHQSPVSPVVSVSSFSALVWFSYKVQDTFVSQPVGRVWHVSAFHWLLSRDDCMRCTTNQQSTSNPCSGCFKYQNQRTMDRFAKLSFADKLKDKAGIIDAAKMVVFDVTVHLPMIYFPTYYTVKEFVGGKTWNPADWVRPMRCDGDAFVCIFSSVVLLSVSALQHLPPNNKLLVLDSVVVLDCRTPDFLFCFPPPRPWTGYRNT